ncbi:TBC1D5 [Symbiodinium natans]|uniref:TBC1D5 protein n=1 Tax=Symbiodinium natans TaxID=878477 RepID=A0A812R9J7_9DINO|nr:TBC1D5 [Symbiodinium natans]
MQLRGRHGVPGSNHLRSQADDDEEVLFQSDDALGLGCSPGLLDTGTTEADQVLFDAATEANTPSDDTRDDDLQEVDATDGQLGPARGLALPVLGSTRLPFNALAAAKYCCQMASRGGLESTSVPPQLRRLMYLRWLGVLRGQTPREWLEELRPRRAEFFRLARQVQDTDASPAEEKQRKQIRLDLARCFSEVPRLSCGAVRAALRQVLEVHVRRSRDLRGEAPVYCQGYHELAAVMLLVCMDGSWPSDPQHVAEQLAASTRMGAVVDTDDVPVYEELASLEAALADALALLEALLYDHRLADMYEPRRGTRTGDAEDDEEAVVATRCKRIFMALRRVSPDLANQIESWDMTPHVLLLRWVRLLFLRELPFPEQLLVAWDTLFADALVFYQVEASPQVRLKITQVLSGESPDLLERSWG